MGLELFVAKLQAGVLSEEGDDVLGVAEEAGGVAMVVAGEVVQEGSGSLSGCRSTVCSMAMSDSMSWAWVCSQL